jgi:hypothetical protein
MFSQERRDRRMIRSAVADIEYFFKCHNELTIHWVFIASSRGVGLSATGNLAGRSGAGWWLGG